MAVPADTATSPTLAPAAAPPLPPGLPAPSPDARGGNGAAVAVAAGDGDASGGGDAAAGAATGDGPSATGELSATAPAFIPSHALRAAAKSSGRDANVIAAAVAATGEGARGVSPSLSSDVLSTLPPTHLKMLRGCFQDEMTGQWYPYYVGFLKSFSSRAGYGFLECAQSYADWQVDVFIHKSMVRTPWQLGQPCEFSVTMNNRGQPQAMDVSWLPALPVRKPPVAKGGAAHPSPGVVLAVGPESRRRDGGGSGASGSAGASSPLPLGATSTPLGASNGAVAERAPPATALPPPLAPNQEPGGEGAAASELRTPSPTGDLQPAVRSAGIGTRDADAHQNTWRLGTLKSFSPAQGYGFIACDEIHHVYTRDVYFDKSQMGSLWLFGATVEFKVIHNSRGHPQARQVDWDPVPYIPNDPQSAPPSSKPRIHSPQTLEKLRKLLRLLHEGQLETAIVTAIDHQGGTHNAEGDDKEVDYVNFCLDRMGTETVAVGTIKDFVKMLLLLMLAKMLRKRLGAKRCLQLVRWFEALANTIDPAVEGVLEHYKDVVLQIRSNLQHANIENEHIHEEAIALAVENSMQRLEGKASATAPAAIADAAP